jgi:hypothetical protein
VAVALAESVTTSSGPYVPWPPISELVIAPVLGSRDMPSGNGGKFVSVLTEKVYGGVPPVAEMVQPAYEEPCVPAGHVVVMMESGPLELPELTVTLAVELEEPEAFVAVRV